MSAWQTACLLKTSAGNFVFDSHSSHICGKCTRTGTRRAGVSNCLGGGDEGGGRGRGGDGECGSNSLLLITSGPEGGDPEAGD